MSPRARLVALPASALVLAALLAAPALYVNDWQARLRGGGARVVPAVTGVADAIALGAVLTPILLLVGLVTLARPALAGRTRGWKIGYALGTLLAQAGATFGLLALVLVTDPYFLGGSLVGRAVSPDGARTAYQYDGGFMCGFDVYVAERGAWTMKRAGGVSLDCVHTAGVHLEWTGAHDVRLVDAAGEPVGSDPVGLDLGPH